MTIQPTYGQRPPQLFDPAGGFVPQNPTAPTAQPVLQRPLMHPGVAAHAAQSQYPSGYGTPPPAWGTGTPPPMAPPTSMHTQQPQQYSGARKSRPGSGTASPAPSGLVVDPDEALKGIESPAGFIVAGLTAILDHVKSSVDASQQRMVDDTEKRLDNLFERLASEQVQRVVLAKLVTLVRSLNARDFMTCNAVAQDLMTTSFDQEGKWVVGLKRLVELAQRV
ncbi:hypothetical protein HDV00_003242 [Rhizophlyctis rosea]|nr:hypothetical protein HDV00_003242 [Rhizophlyctis rosea]